MSKDGDKKSTGRDISDLKARLGLKKGDARSTGAVPPPGKVGGAYIPPPPGVAPPPPAKPVVPDARDDPFGAMNAIAAHSAVARAPEIIVVDKHSVEKVEQASKVAHYGKIAAIILAPLIVGFLLGGINYERRSFNKNLGDAKLLYGEFQGLRTKLDDLNTVLLRAKERGQGGRSYKLFDAELISDLEKLNFSMEDDDKLIVYHKNLYNLEPKLVQDTLLFYSRTRALSTKVKEHIRQSKDTMQRLPAEAREKVGAGSMFGAIVKMPTPDEASKGGRPAVEVVQLGQVVCADNKPADKCPDNSPPTQMMLRSEVGGPWTPKPLGAGTDLGDKVLFVRPNMMLSALLEGSQRFLDELEYLQRLSEIDILVSGGGGNDGGLMKERKDIEDRMNAVVQRGKAFAL